MIDRGKIADAQPFGRGNDGGVHGAEGKVAVPGHELGDPQPVAGRDGIDRERA